ncbi:MAG: ABC transporter permease subunit [Spirochaetaceae bacterium]
MRSKLTSGSILKDFRKNYQLHIIVLIPIVFIIIFNYIPMYGVQIAFKNFIPIKGIMDSPWVGLKYFKRFFDSPMFGRVMWNTISLSVYQLVAGFPIPILLALAMNNTKKKLFKKNVQMWTYAPHFISTVVLIGMMYQFFSPKLGIVNDVIKLFGGDPKMFMGNPMYFRHMFVWSGVWQRAGWSSIIYLSALSAVDTSLHEAAIVDGANRLQRVWHIDIPAIVPTMVTLFILNFGRVMSIGFEKALLMQNATNLEASEIISTYVYKVGLASTVPNFSYASAIGLFNSAINFALLIIVNRAAKKMTETSLW